MVVAGLRGPGAVRAAAERPLDGDEAIVGLMALEVLDHPSPPTYFWGQGFGLSTLETSLVAGAFAFLPADTRTVRLTGLALFALSCGAFLVFARRTLGAGPALLATTLVALAPAFDPLAVSCRGYTLGGFATACLLGVLATRAGTWSRPALRGLLLGGGCAVSAATHLGFTLAVLPFVLGAIVDRSREGDRRAAITATAVGAVLAGAFLGSLRPSTAEISWAANYLVDSPAAVGRNLWHLPARLAVFATGRYDLDHAFPAASITWIAAIAVLAAAALGSIACAANPEATATRRRALYATALTLGLVLLLDPERAGYRHFLPLLLPFALLAGNAARGARNRRWPALAVAGLGLLLLVRSALVLGECPLVREDPTLRPTERSEARSLAELLDVLREHGVEHVYSLDPMLPWTLRFESGREISARWRLAKDRRTELVRAVEDARLEGRPIALVGSARSWSAIEPLLPLLEGPLDTRTDRWFVALRPSLGLLRSLRFEGLAD